MPEYYKSLTSACFLPSLFTCQLVLILADCCFASMLFLQTLSRLAPGKQSTKGVVILYQGGCHPL